MSSANVDIKEIDKRALTLLEDVFGSVDSIRLPIDLNKITEYCGLTIKQGKFKDDDLEGALDRSNATIFLSEEDSFEGKNFTIAHELGHFKLHEDVKTDIFTMHQLKNLLNRQGKDDREDAADRFAASLLMPEKLLKSLWEVTQDTRSLSKIFGVPEIVVRYRVNSLKLKRS